MTTQPPSEFDFSARDGKDNVVKYAKKSSYINQQYGEDYLQSGKCNDPKLKGVIRKIRSGQDVLPGSRAKKLVDTQKKAAEAIYEKINLVGEAIEKIQRCKEDSQVNKDGSLRNLEIELTNGLSSLTDYLEQVLNIACKHGFPPAKNKDEYQDFKEYLEEIRYFQRFLANQAHASTVTFEGSPFSQAYFRRMDSYLGYLPNSCRFLVNATRQNIFDQVPGHQSDEIIL